jgi:AraC family transcriptional regulator, transcriptional activator of pobA
MKKHTDTFEIQTIEEFVHANSSDISTQQRYDDYTILLLESGYLFMTIDMEPQQMKGMAVAFIGKNRQWSVSDARCCRGYVLCFSAEYFCRQAADVRFLHRSMVFDVLKSPCFTCLNIKPISDIISIILSEHKEQMEFCSDIIRQQLSTIMLLGERAVNQRNIKIYAEQEDFKQMRVFKQMVEEHYTDIKSVNRYAEMMLITNKRLTTLISNTTGKTPKQILNERITLEARRLLRYCSWSVKEISNKLGFSEETNFTKFFKQQTGQTPLEFRNMDILNHQISEKN